MAAPFVAGAWVAVLAFGGGPAVNPLSRLGDALDVKTILSVERGTSSTSYRWSAEHRDDGSFFLEVTVYPRPEAAESAFKALVAKADHNTGLSYAWDHVVLDGSRVLHLEAPCLLTSERFGALSRRLDAILHAGAGQTLHCVCGGGCDPRGADGGA
jgi:hypothetical protein